MLYILLQTLYFWIFSRKIYLITFSHICMYILEKEMMYINMYMYISIYKFFVLYRYHPSSSSWILSSWNSCWKRKSNRCWHGKKCWSRLPHYWWRWDRYVWHYNWEGHTGRHHYCEKGVQLQHKKASLCLASRDFICTVCSCISYQKKKHWYAQLSFALQQIRRLWCQRAS